MNQSQEISLELLKEIFEKTPQTNEHPEKYVALTWPEFRVSATIWRDGTVTLFMGMKRVSDIFPVLEAIKECCEVEDTEGL